MPSETVDTNRWIEAVTGQAVVGPPTLVQELWSGFGRLERVALKSTTVVLKSVEPGLAGHPRGWSGGRSHARKLRSYEVERTFYANFAGRLGDAARVPRHLAGRDTESGGQLLLEDLDLAGFAARREDVSDAEANACLCWLAAFHAAFLPIEPSGLWPRGTYWHLATRPDELASMTDERLQRAAPVIDARLESARFRTLVHGDAKLANFCFGSGDREGVAAVDFQYVGGGVGVQDVAYFLGSCYGDDALERRAEDALEVYFQALKEALGRRDSSQWGSDSGALEREWRTLWPYAWADFHRFLDGWAPDHWKLSRYSRDRVTEILDDCL